MRYRTLIWSCLDSLFHMFRLIIWKKATLVVARVAQSGLKVMGDFNQLILVAGISRTPVWDRRLSLQRLFF